MRRQKPLLPVAPPRPLALFVCEPINEARLSRASCGERHAAAKRKGEKGKLALVTGTCAGCPVGAAHARGRAPARWPDGRAVRVLEVMPRTGTERVAR